MTLPTLAHYPHWVFDMDGTLTVSVHDFPAIRRHLGVPAGADLLTHLDTLPAEARRAKHAWLLDHERALALDARCTRSGGTGAQALRARLPAGHSDPQCPRTCPHHPGGDLHFLKQRNRSARTYASLKQCLLELAEVEAFYRRHRIPYLNTTNYSVEEIATRLMDRLGKQTVQATIEALRHKRLLCRSGRGSYAFENTSMLDWLLTL